jgi:hypothetical protein
MAMARRNQGERGQCGPNTRDSYAAMDESACVLKIDPVELSEGAILTSASLRAHVENGVYDFPRQIESVRLTWVPLTETA